MGQIWNILALVARKVSVTTIQFCHCSQGVIVSLCSNKTLFTKLSSGPDSSTPELDTVVYWSCWAWGPFSFSNEGLWCTDFRGDRFTVPIRDLVPEVTGKTGWELKWLCLEPVCQPESFHIALEVQCWNLEKHWCWSVISNESSCIPPFSWAGA